MKTILAIIAVLVLVGCGKPIKDGDMALPERPYRLYVDTVNNHEYVVAYACQIREAVSIAHATHCKCLERLVHP